MTTVKLTETGTATIVTSETGTSKPTVTASLTPTETGIVTTGQTTSGTIAIQTIVTPNGPTGGIDTGGWAPGIKIYVDGTFQGTTPTLLTDVPAGTHTITAEKDDEFAEIENFDVSDGKIAKLPVKSLDQTFSVVYGEVDPSTVCCNATAYNASVRVNKTFFAYELETYYRWDDSSKTAQYTLYKDGKKFLQGQLKRGPEINGTGKCKNFTESEDQVKREIPAGLYTISVKKQALCLNSTSSKKEGILYFEGYDLTKTAVPTKTVKP